MGIWENNIYKEVHPTFLYESIGVSILFFILMYINKKRVWKGETTAIYFISYSLIRFFVEGIRIDSLMLYHVRISQVLSGIIFVISCIFLLYKMKKYKTNKKNDKK